MLFRSLKFGTGQALDADDSDDEKDTAVVEKQPGKTPRPTPVKSKTCQNQKCLKKLGMTNKVPGLHRATYGIRAPPTD